MKKILSILLLVVVIFTLGGCAAKKEAVTTDKKIIKVGASPIPHKEILEVVKPILAKEGYTLQIVEFTDYVTPNTALAEKQLDANFFQHVPYLTEFSKSKGLDLVWTVKVHIEPMALYSAKYKKLSDIKDGASIAIPNDPTNGARALRVLEKAGLIKLKTGDLISKIDITENKKKLNIKELEAPQLPRVLKDVDAAVINSNYAMTAKLKLTDALAIEAKDSPYANVLAVRKEDKDKPYIKALSKALTSPEVKKFILSKYKGAVIPAF
ncbi:MetQ/NlpA family ABC transporter substrate-binding protein [Clostridium estertheticum]|uniref:Lipoprotein n=1 Tax=Clostridium estertheticum TaxID=238834 RepID=A0A7Y3ST93_9CLOT|nr:MetQ/NlpA family ABC transporter substrate-binding protein [Clostridium estertheticum]MBW9170085.1 MetQ/NlpA family ABC transporter substrate-binding protein [Clostridium estertheticum]NNU74946.1 MetQ/NlpA family ABC transporter substrate-binding protein [Clostridium estertheticum]WBL47403.1 MetQ/NlpA family ABC transporter substrate-binding protein [Clostridium estertheticum]WLC75565.1 MetQ/NlpA family ABC transporter substrate-binding protein [Clostridium estertheticum]